VRHSSRLRGGTGARSRRAEGGSDGDGSRELGSPAALDDDRRSAPLFYGTFALVTVIGAGLVLLPNVPLVAILVLSQVLNAVLLLPLLWFMYGISRDRDLMGDYTAGRGTASGYLIAIAVIAVCIIALGVLSIAS
jgi:Mn2+/Fe2+ NRAMP family transporter